MDSLLVVFGGIPDGECVATAVDPCTANATSDVDEASVSELDRPRVLNNPVLPVDLVLPVANQAEMESAR